VAIAAVADGLGSAAHSDVGSKIAVSIAAEYCRENITAITEPQQILDVTRAAFTAALRAIEKEANKKDRSQDLYDTTLTLAVLIRDALYYGHSGDSGIIALSTQGRYESVTKQQRDQEGRVFPLFFEDKWEFAQYENKVSAVLLATDGMFEPFFPIYIRNNPINIHVSLAQFFMDIRNLRIAKLGEDAIQVNMSDYMEKIPDEQVNDDKTVVVLINSSIRTKRQPKEYYQEPDWAELKNKYDDEWRRAAYPGLYKESQTAPASEASPAKQEKMNPSASQPGKQASKSTVSGRKLSTAHKPRKPKRLYILLLAVLVFGLSTTGVAIGFVMWGSSENGERPVILTLPEPANMPISELETEVELDLPQIPVLESTQEPTPDTAPEQTPTPTLEPTSGPEAVAVPDTTTEPMPESITEPTYDLDFEQSSVQTSDSEDEQYPDLTYASDDDDYYGGGDQEASSYGAAPEY